MGVQHYDSCINFSIISSRMTVTSIILNENLICSSNVGSPFVENNDDKYLEWKSTNIGVVPRVTDTSHLHAQTDKSCTFKLSKICTDFKNSGGRNCGAMRTARCDCNNNDNDSSPFNAPRPLCENNQCDICEEFISLGGIACSNRIDADRCN
ncbi:hypothetical protein BD770DRAFT_408413 [Pilaira anomala]|nr:hypothetical protein BD770DRAFT_408413 [Pilaira anomala]